MRLKIFLLTITAGLHLCFLAIPAHLFAQSQFPKGWALYLEGDQGMNTNFSAAPDLYLGQLNLKPMVTVIPDHLRLGAAAGLTYTNKTIDGTIGPLVAWKLAAFSFLQQGFANLQLQAGMSWGGSGHALVGGGPYLEVARKFQFGLTTWRDYGVNTWWFQFGIAYNLIKTKFATDPFHP